MTQAAVLRASVLLAVIAAVGLVVVLGRLAAALLGHETAPWAPGLALLGLGIGGAGVGLAVPRASLARVLSLLGVLAGAASLATIVATIAVVRLAPPIDGGLAAPARLAIVGALCTAPFALVGAAVVAAIAHARTGAPRIAAFGLAGAAGGIPIAVALLRGVGAPRAALLLAILLALTGVAASTGGVLARGRSRAGHPAIAWGFLLGALAVLGGELGAPWLRLTHTRGARADRAELVRWSELGLVTADIPSRGGLAWIRTDGVSTSAAVAAGSEPPKHPDQIGYAVPGARSPVLIVGAGAGRDVRAAIAARQGEIYAVEVDRTVVDEVLHGRLREHAGDVYERPEVKLVVVDPRGYAARNPESFRTIVTSSAEAPGDRGTTGLGDAGGLLTVEGATALLEALTPDGVLVVSRSDAEAPRVVTVLAAALRARGAEAPRAHLFACRHQKATAVLAARERLAADTVQTLRGWCKRGRYGEVLAPDRAVVDDLAALADDPAAAARGDRDLSPPTDDRPSFGYGVPRGGLWAALGSRATLAREPLLASATLLAALGGVVVLILAGLARLGGRVDTTGSTAAPRGIVFLALLGAGHVVVLVGLVGRLAPFMAHPSHLLLVVTTTLLVAAAAGAATARRVGARAIHTVVARRAQALAILLAILAVVLGPLLAAGDGVPIPARVVVSALVAAPVGFLAGGLVPLALRALASWSPARASLGAAVVAGGALLGAGVGQVLALHAGLAYLMLLGASLHLVASVGVPRPAHPRA